MQSMNRREMLKCTTVAGAAAMVLTNGILAKGQSPNEKLAVACIGIGGQGNDQVSKLGKMTDAVDLVALCDVDDVRAGKAYQTYPKAKKYYDFRKMFDEMEKSFDAVAVSTPDHFHYHPVIRALRAGKHVYCEKPLAHSVAEVRIIAETAAEKKLATQLGCQRHAFGNMHRVVELIKSGAVGEVKEVYSWIGGDRGMPEMPAKEVPPPPSLHWDLWLGPCPKDWKYAVRVAQDGKETPAFAPYNWRFWRDFGTGETGNWACHILDIPYWALDLKYPVKVSASGPEVDALRTPKQMDVVYDFPARGDLPPVKLHWSHTKNPACLEKYGLKNVQTVDGKSIGANNLFVGTKGFLLTGFDRHALLPAAQFADFEYPKRFIPDSPGFHQEWVTACKGGERATCDFSYSAPMAETAILGNTAFFAGHKTFDWDAATLTAKNCPEVQALLKPEFRKGWTY